MCSSGLVQQLVYFKGQLNNTLENSCHKRRLVLRQLIATMCPLSAQGGVAMERVTRGSLCVCDLVMDWGTVHGADGLLVSPPALSTSLKNCIKMTGCNFKSFYVRSGYLTNIRVDLSGVVGVKTPACCCLSFTDLKPVLFL